MFICQFCEKVLVKRSGIVIHEKSCHNNPNRIPRKTGPAKGSKPWNKGLNKNDKRVAAIINNRTYPKKRKSLSKEDCQKISDRMKKQYAAGWEPTCGRSKKYDYISPIAGKIKVDGTWELKAARYLDNLGVKWIRNKKRFPYKNGDKESTYQPDFYVADWDMFIEVKGYETDLDRLKWSQFPLTLEVWKKDKIFSLES